MTCTGQLRTARPGNARLALALTTGLLLLVPACSRSDKKTSQPAHPGARQMADEAREKQAFDIGVDAYIYGYPLVSMETTRRIMTNTVEPRGMRAPMGQFVHQRTYPDASFTMVTTPNADTLYSTAWLDVSREPYILRVPSTVGRYYVMEMLDAWTNVFAAPGTRTTGTRAQTFAITGPDWQGTLPKGVQQLASPTNTVWIIGRTYSIGTRRDLAKARAIQDKYVLMPLGAMGTRYTPPAGRFDPAIDMETPTRTQVNELDAATFFAILAAQMQNNPPAPADAPMLASLAKIGIEPGKEFDMGKLDPATARGLERAPAAALERMYAHREHAGIVSNGWLVTLRTGNYGTDYLQRAYIAAIGLGANRPEDAVYPITQVDSRGRPLSGAHDYVLHVPRGQMPPVKAFWSLTMYNKDYFFVKNRLDRYTLSPRNRLKYNPDGSLDLYIQHESPGRYKESNWLPAPAGEFVLALRLYWPENAVLEGSWNPPPVTRQ